MDNLLNLFKNLIASYYHHHLYYGKNSIYNHYHLYYHLPVPVFITGLSVVCVCLKTASTIFSGNIFRMRSKNESKVATVVLGEAEDDKE